MVAPAACLFLLMRNTLKATFLTFLKILLIVAGLEEDNLKRLYNTARDFQLDVLVEVHDLPEMETALDLGADLIGINNRNLKTFTTDLSTTEKLVEEVPDEVILVSESGIKNPLDASGRNRS